MRYLGKKIKYLNHEFLVVKYDKDDSIRTYEIVLLKKFRFFRDARLSHIYQTLGNGFIRSKEELLKNFEKTRFELCKNLDFIEDSEEWSYFIKVWVDEETVASNLIGEHSDNNLFDIYDL